MVITLTIPDEMASWLSSVAAERGITAEAAAFEMIDRARDHNVDVEFLALVDEVIADHRVILDRLAT